MDSNHDDPGVLEGMVYSFDGAVYKVHCPKAPRRDFKMVFVEPWAMHSAQIGDRVQLEYRSGTIGSCWVVSEVL